MRTADQVRWDFVQEWLRKAESDIAAARILVAEKLDDYQVAAFHAQQAVEKLIKAYLVRHQVEFAKDPRDQGAPRPGGVGRPGAGCGTG